ncbi:MAG: sodium:proton antiporter [Bacillus sp. (in: Bacteria)]|nr:sodium:proton antiporter [Bacillus sp. (in: firmicutes)]
MQRLLVIVGIVFGLLSLFNNRFRFLNAFLSNKWLRRAAVSLVMRIPAVREKMMYQMLR